MSKPRTVRFPEALGEALEIRAKQLGYASLSDYIKALVRYDLTVQGPHEATLPWSKLSPSEQDKIDENLLALTKRGKGVRGQLLAHILERVKDPSKIADGLKDAA
ncbi:hypothetical protein [Verrucomicrobium sp. BvORR106]|uniref:hypothetical protein n=1 Tax=Verrucomicrobium sp. BvORR106 TaxID=1403819 RepID=UPI00057114BF|nr:hypothetical protein [Verrucomicrobium sp. BvORR106]